MSIRRQSRPPRPSSTRTCPSLLTPVKTVRQRLSRSPVGRAMIVATTSTVTASKEARRETGTLPNVRSSPTFTASTWTISQTGITVCGVLRDYVGIYELTTTGLGDVRAQNCSFQKGVQYCGKYYWGETTTTTDADSSVAAASGAAGSASSGASMTSAAPYSNGTLAAASNATLAAAPSSDATPTTTAAAAGPSSSSGDSKSSLPVRVSLPASFFPPLLF